jgi:hypothetical protein
MSLGPPDELRTLRRRQLDLAPALDGRRDDPRAGAPSFACQVYDAGHMPTALPGYFAVRPIPALGGTEAEGRGTSAGATADASAIVLVVGNQVPAAGDILFADLISGRWVAERRGTGGSTLVTTTGCPCAAGPGTIFMTTQGFDPGYYNPPLHPDTLDWSTTYPNFGIGSSYWLGRALWNDGDLPPFQYQYVISCVVNTTFYVLRRRYTDMTTDPSSYKWAIGLTGNQCVGQRLPGGGISAVWQMLNGSGNVAYPGFNVTLTG